MLAILHLLAMFVADLFKPRLQLEVENISSSPAQIALRRAPCRCAAWERPSVVGMTTSCRGIEQDFAPIGAGSPGTRPGRPPVSRELRDLTYQMSKGNLGTPRIRGELLKLGFEVAQSSVAKYMLKRPGPPSPGWRAFLRSPSRQGR